MVCISWPTKLVDGRGYGLKGVMGYQKYGLRGVRLYLQDPLILHRNNHQEQGFFCVALVSLNEITSKLRVVLKEQPLY